MTPRCSTPKCAISAPSENPTSAPSEEADRGLLRGEERRVGGCTSEQRRPLRRGGSKSGSDDVVQVRHGAVVHRKRPRPPRLLPEPSISLPERPRGRRERATQHARCAAERSERTAHAGTPPPRSAAALIEAATRVDAVALDPKRTVARAEGAAGAHRGRGRRPARRLDGDLGAGARVAPRPRRRDAGATSRSTPRATSGSRSRASPSGPCSIGGHIDSVPNGGWLDGCLNVVAGRRGAPRGSPGTARRPSPCASSTGPTRKARASAAASSARAPLPARWPTRTSCGSSPIGDGVGAPRCARRARRRSRRARSTRARELETRSRVPRAPHRAGPGARVARPSARRRPRDVRRRAPPRSRGAARRRMPGRRRWTSAATRSPALRSWPSRSARSHVEPAAAQSARRAASSASPAS